MAGKVWEFTRPLGERSEERSAAGALGSAEFLDRVAHHCADLLDVAAAGVLLVGPGGDLHAAATFTHAATPHLAALISAHTDDSPSADCCHLREPVLETDLDEVADRWPRFATDARRAGVCGVLAVPLHDRDTSIGALELLATESGRLGAAHVRMLDAIADIAVAGLLQRYSTSKGMPGVSHLQSALDSRVVIEQAKGMLAQRGGVDVERAFQALFRFAHNEQLGLVEVAGAVVDGTVDSSRVLDVLSTGGVRQQQDLPK